MQSTPYSVLGLSRDASAAEVRAAYMRLARLHHPDKNGGDPGATERFAAVSAAFEEINANRGGEEADLAAMFERLSSVCRRVRTCVMYVDLEDVVHGTTRRVALPDPEGRHVDVEVPPGTPEGEVVYQDQTGVRVRVNHRLPPEVAIAGDGTLVWTERVDVRDVLAGFARTLTPCRGVELTVDTGGGPLDPSKAWRFTGRGIAGGDAVVRFKVAWNMAPIVAAHAGIARALAR